MNYGFYSAEDQLKMIPHLLYILDRSTGINKPQNQLSPDYSMGDAMFNTRHLLQILSLAIPKQLWRDIRTQMKTDQSSRSKMSKLY